MVKVISSCYLVFMTSTSTVSSQRHRSSGLDANKLRGYVDARINYLEQNIKDLKNQATNIKDLADSTTYLEEEIQYLSEQVHTFDGEAIAASVIEMTDRVGQLENDLDGLYDGQTNLETTVGKITKYLEGFVERFGEVVGERPVWDEVDVDPAGSLDEIGENEAKINDIIKDSEDTQPQPGQLSDLMNDYFPISEVALEKYPRGPIKDSKSAYQAYVDYDEDYDSYEGDVYGGNYSYDYSADNYEY